MSCALRSLRIYFCSSLNDELNLFEVRTTQTLGRERDVTMTVHQFVIASNAHSVFPVLSCLMVSFQTKIRAVCHSLFTASTRTPILLGESRLSQFNALSCLVAQSISILVTMIIYSSELRLVSSALTYVWWPVIDLIRISHLGVFRVDRLIRSEPAFFFPNNDRALYRTIALLNGLGLFWAFPMWPIYASISLKDDEVSNVLLVITSISIALHIISSIPSFSIRCLSCMEQVCVHHGPICDSDSD